MICEIFQHLALIHIQTGDMTCMQYCVFAFWHPIWHVHLTCIPAVKTRTGVLCHLHLACSLKMCSGLLIRRAYVDSFICLVCICYFRNRLVHLIIKHVRLEPYLTCSLTCDHLKLQVWCVTLWCAPQNVRNRGKAQRSMHLDPVNICCILQNRVCFALCARCTIRCVWRSMSTAYTAKRDCVCDRKEDISLSIHS